MATHPQMKSIIDPMRKDTQVAADTKILMLTSCRHVLLVVHGITRKPGLTFPGKPGHAFDQEKYGCLNLH